MSVLSVVRFRRRGLVRAAACSVALAALLALVPSLAAQQAASTLPAEDGTSLSDSLALMESVFDGDEAMKLLAAIDPFYRVRGNQGYLRSLERALAMARSAGFVEPGGDAEDTVEFRDFGPSMPAWTPVSAELSIISPDVGVLHGFETEAGLERTFLCVNSFPTGDDGIVAPLVRYEHSRPVETYAGAVVYGRLPSEVLFERAVQQGRALGVISSYLPDYNQPDRNTDAIRYSSVPYDVDRQGFGLNVSPAKRAVIERLLGGGMVYVRVHIAARFAEQRSRTLVINVGGSEEHAGTVALVAHLDEPGANDNASGVAATVAMASGYLRAIRDGRIPRPRRSITFLIGTEFECSREWLRSTSGDIDMALIVDMVGEGPGNGADALVERMPDPGAIWDRPPLDIHSEWGRSDVRESDLQGSFLNDYVMAAMRARAANVGWRVRSNPYEGGSDHESFLERGIPSVLLWHFTDPYYHTSLDRIDKVDPQEIQNVAVSTLAVVHHFSSAGIPRAEEVLDIVMDAARLRLSTESSTALAYLSAPAVTNDESQCSLVSDRERSIVVAWSRWYREAVLSVEKFEPNAGRVDERLHLEGRIDEALHELRGLEHAALAVLEP